MGIWTMIQYIDTPLTLLAFISAVLAWTYSVKWKGKAKLLKALPESERAAYLEKELGSDPVDVVQKGATEQQKFELMQLAILQKARHLKIVAVTAITITAILAITIIISGFLPGNYTHLSGSSKEASQSVSEQLGVKNFLTKKVVEITSQLTTHNIVLLKKNTRKNYLKLQRLIKNF